ncbi:MULTISPECIES: DUF4156 domain-containing protein [Corallococcus]|uniref:DUF4156 domain-containing protein n=1 Tax=Corallococcus TaxID=83461 RepID=UPI0013776781|nr:MULTISPECIES: DUF4156 domain-containing protein [Corallococcus]NBD12561.1 DUF4156 domain-containing protein [Corallococcus silvisoli]
MNWKQMLVGVVALGPMTGCVTAALSKAGSQVTPVPAAPGPECQNLGMVIGTGGGSFGGAYISNDQLMEYALNDVMNKAAARGATHVQANQPQLGGASGTTTTATVMAIAYKCPGAAGAGAAQALPPVEKSYLTDCPAKEGESLRARAIRCKAVAKEQAGE